MPARLLLLGLDAAQPTVFHGEGAEERFPTISAIRKSGATGRLVGHHKVMTDTVWPELRTGSSGVRTRIYYQPRQIRTGERRARARRPDELGSERFYWNVAADSGLRVAAADQPLTPARLEGDAVEVAEWGTHDRLGFGALPRQAGALAIAAAHGDYPVLECDRINDGTPSGAKKLLEGIMTGVERKTALLNDLLDSDDWDLFTGVYSEAHCAGHHFWPLGAQDSARRAAIDAVYAALDAGIGTLLAKAGGDTTVIVYTSHGMGQADHGVALVADVLERMGAVTGNRRRRRLAAWVPGALRGRIKQVVPSTAVQRVGLTHDRPLGGRNTLAIPLPNSRHGAIRLSVKGRDPGGSLVAGSADHRRFLGDLETEFMGLRKADTGESVVSDVVAMDDLFGEDRHPDLPDVVVRFRRDIGVIGVCRSESLGTIRPVSRDHRTGEHGTPGAIWATGPGISQGSSLGDVRSVDLAPTVLGALGLPVPAWVDGAPITPISGA